MFPQKSTWWKKLGIFFEIIFHTFHAYLLSFFLSSPFQRKYIWHKILNFCFAAFYLNYLCCFLREQDWNNIENRWNLIQFNQTLEGSNIELYLLTFSAIRFISKANSTCCCGKTIVDVFSFGGARVFASSQTQTTCGI